MHAGDISPDCEVQRDGVLRNALVACSWDVGYYNVPRLARGEVDHVRADCLDGDEFESWALV